MYNVPKGKISQFISLALQLIKFLNIKIAVLSYANIKKTELFRNPHRKHLQLITVQWITVLGERVVEYTKVVFKEIWKVKYHNPNILKEILRRKYTQVESLKNDTSYKAYFLKLISITDLYTCDMNKLLISGSDPTW